LFNLSSLEKLRTDVRGAVLCPGQDGYDAARTIPNAMIDRRPAVIVRCAGAGDVIACVRFAREHDLLVAVRGGGHSVAGKSVCDNGLMIDLSAMKGMRVDPARRTVRAQTGLTLGEFDRETQAFGLATTLGVVSKTGIAGLTLGAGWGNLHAKYGLALDNVIGADVVTADGRLLTANASENADLFWGVRGRGQPGYRDFTGIPLARSGSRARWRRFLSGGKSPRSSSLLSGICRNDPRRIGHSMWFLYDSGRRSGFCGCRVLLWAAT
jgi:FAD binding domain